MNLIHRDDRLMRGRKKRGGERDEEEKRGRRESV
jgi:hypothetical protein